IILGVAVSSGVFYPLALWRISSPGYPRSILVMDSVLLIVAMGGVRLGRRLLHELDRFERNARVLVWGAGDAGEMLVRDIKGNPKRDFEPIGFVDDDPAKTGLRIHGVPVLGTREALPMIIEQTRPREVLVAIPGASAQIIREIVDAL